MNRALRSDSPKRVTGGVDSARHKLNTRWSLSSRYGLLMDTALLGLIWWFGGKQGAW